LIAASVNNTLPAPAKELGGLLFIEVFDPQLSLNHPSAQISNQSKHIPASHTAIALLNQQRSELVQMLSKWT
jgi:hypothetical protein